MGNTLINWPTLQLQHVIPHDRSHQDVYHNFDLDKACWCLQHQCCSHWCLLTWLIVVSGAVLYSVSEPWFLCCKLHNTLTSRSTISLNIFVVSCVQLWSIVSQLLLIRSPQNIVLGTSLWHCVFLSVISESALCRVRQDRLSHSLMYIYLYFARKLNRLKNRKPP